MESDKRFEGLCDYHTQTLEHGLNKTTKVRQTIEAAITAGLKSICLTDHYLLPPSFVDPTREKDCAMPASEYPRYMLEADTVIAEVGVAVTVLRGAEVDWLPAHRDWTARQIATPWFDYVLGSVHFLGEIEDDLGRRNLLLDYERPEFDRGANYHGGARPLVVAYYTEVRAMVETGLFDGVGHLDLIKKFSVAGDLFDESEAWYREQITLTLDTIATSGMSMEINGAGLEKPCKQVYPSPWIVAEAKGRGIPITIGSDAHKPEDIGKNLDAAVRVAQQAGYRELAEYRARKRVKVII